MLHNVTSHEIDSLTEIARRGGRLAGGRENTQVTNRLERKGYVRFTGTPAGVEITPLAVDLLTGLDRLPTTTPQEPTVRPTVTRTERHDITSYKTRRGAENYVAKKAPHLNLQVEEREITRNIGGQVHRLGSFTYVVVRVVTTTLEDPGTTTTCIDCGAVVPTIATGNGEHGLPRCPKSTSTTFPRHRVNGDVYRAAVAYEDALANARLGANGWTVVEALHGDTDCPASVADAPSEHVGCDLAEPRDFATVVCDTWNDNLRPATEQETADHLAGHASLPGAQETEHGLLVAGSPHQHEDGPDGPGEGSCTDECYANHPDHADGREPDCEDCGGTGAVPAAGWEPEDDVDNGYVACPSCTASSHVEGDLAESLVRTFGEGASLVVITRDLWEHVKALLTTEQQEALRQRGDYLVPLDVLA